MIIAWLAMMLFAFHASTHMVGAGDTWVALACGRHFINHGVDTVEPFSANSHKPGPTKEEIKTWPEWAQSITRHVSLKTVKYWHPTGWIDQNWLTHVMFYYLTHLSPFADDANWAFNTLVYWKFAIYIITVICVYYTGRILGANPALSAVFACAAMFIGRSFLDIRPAGFSNLLVAAFLLVLALSTYRNVLYIWLIVPLTVFWANVHGGYIYVFIMMVPFIGLNLITSVSNKRFVSIGRRGITQALAAAAVAFIASILFNPFHLTNLTHTFVISISKNAAGWRNVHEWWPAFAWTNPVGTGFPLLVMLILAVGLLVLWLLSRLLYPAKIKAPKSQLEAQKRFFSIFSKILAFALAVLLFWAVLISFSLADASPATLFIAILFTAVLWAAVFKNIHFIYLLILVALFAIYTGGDIKHGFTGRYIYPFLIIPAFVTTNIIASLLSKKVKSTPYNIVIVVAVAVAALLLITQIFNPFSFSKSIWYVEQFVHLKRPWHPIYERNLDLKYTHLFAAIYLVNGLAIVFWLLDSLRKTFYARTPQQKTPQPNPQNNQPETSVFRLGKIDLALMVIAALTVYMALRSRRFIPIAAIAACPLMAMSIDRMTRIIASVLNFHKTGRLTVPAVPAGLQRFFIVLAVVVVAGLGGYWIARFKYVYLDSWPTDTRLTSVFMRMTASHMKPFYACQFIKQNKLSGKMFNYWTEGGFIAWGQQPDPNTGKTPLQLFMDGRAQAAYNYKAYITWSEMMFGGPIVREAAIRKRKLTPKDYEKIGKWLDKKLTGYHVWVVLMPANQFDKPFVRALETHPKWQIAFLNDKQKLFVDIRSAKGKRLFDGIADGKTVYPNKYHKNLILANNLFFFGRDAAAKSKGLELAIEAFNLVPSRTPLYLISRYAKIPTCAKRAAEFYRVCFADFLKNRQKYIVQSGFYFRSLGALASVDNLQLIAKRQKDAEKVSYYNKLRAEFVRDLKKLSDKRW